ncbi:MAG: S8 family serine peptidase [Chloroflexi bacterium]|nr:S8 family serine peptidase [Chloroflexota bacterium]
MATLPSSLGRLSGMGAPPVRHDGRGSLAAYGIPRPAVRAGQASSPWAPGYAAISGTPMATPHVAGLLALLKHRNPAMTEREFKAAIRMRGGPFNAATGWGVARWIWFGNLTSQSR